MGLTWHLASVVGSGFCGFSPEKWEDIPKYYCLIILKKTLKLVFSCKNETKMKGGSEFWMPQPFYKQQLQNVAYK